jgi:hypothetical protein
LEDISEISYKKPKFPYYIYSEIENYEQDINIFFTFKITHLKNKTYLSMSRINNLKISYLIIEKKLILDYIKNKQNNLRKYEGIIDPSIGIRQIYISKEILKNYKKNNNNKLLITIEKIEEEDTNI